MKALGARSILAVTTTVVLMVLVAVAAACAPSTPTPSSSNSPLSGSSGSGKGTGTTAGATPNTAAPTTTAPPTTASRPPTLGGTSSSTAKNLLTAGAPCDQSQVGSRAVTDSGEQLVCTLRPGSSQARWLPAR